MLDGLAAIHAVNCFHRDVAPDNILLAQDGPLLLDFGAARRVIGNLTHDLSAVVKPGFSPIEQYAEDSSLAQGPWTDLYALAAVMFTAMTGKALQPSVDRVKDDRLEPLSVVAKGRFSARLLAAVDCALAIRPQDRPQNVAEFRRILGDEATVDLAATGTGDALRQATFQDLPVDFEPGSPVRAAQAWIAAGLAPAVDPASARHDAAAAAGRTGRARTAAGLAIDRIGRDRGRRYDPRAKLRSPVEARTAGTTAPASAPVATGRAGPAFGAAKHRPPRRMKAPPVESSGAITPLYASPANVASKPSWMRDGPPAPGCCCTCCSACRSSWCLGRDINSFWPLGDRASRRANTQAPPVSTAAATSSAAAIDLDATRATRKTATRASADGEAAPAPVRRGRSGAPQPEPVAGPCRPKAGVTRGRGGTVESACRRGSATSLAPADAPGARPSKPERHRASQSLTARRPAANRARCTEILQSASLGPLSAGESAFLKRECHR